MAGTAGMKNFTLSFAAGHSRRNFINMRQKKGPRKGLIFLALAVMRGDIVIGSLFFLTLAC